VNCFATNGVGDTAFCSFTVTVEDRLSPVITCPQDIVVNPSTLEGERVNYTMPVATDNCSATITQTGGLSSGSLFPIGTTLNEFTAIDAAGNKSICSFKITVTDPHCGSNKVNVCKSGTTACVEEADVPEYLSSGATLGACASGGRFSNNAIPNKLTGIPAAYVLENYPNPFFTTTKIQYALVADAYVSLAVYNELGLKVAQLIEDRMSAGYHVVDFNGSSLAAGIYYYRLTVNTADKKTFVLMKKMVLMK
jgi:hypothetical protein